MYAHTHLKKSLDFHRTKNQVMSMFKGNSRGTEKDEWATGQENKGSPILWMYSTELVGKS